MDKDTDDYHYVAALPSSDVSIVLPEDDGLEDSEDIGSGEMDFPEVDDDEPILDIRSHPVVDASSHASYHQARYHCYRPPPLQVGRTLQVGRKAQHEEEFDSDDIDE